MRRREFIRFTAAATAWPLAARAQQRAMPVIGIRNSSSPDADGDRMRAYHRCLSESGYVEGRNLTVEYRWADGQNERLPAMAVDLVRRGVSVIVTGGTPATLAAKALTSTIPIVFILSTDPVEIGARFAHSGARLTYGPNQPNSVRRLATYVHRVLTGTKPSALPIEQPTTFELVVNQRMSRRLGIELPPMLLARADEVIE